MRNVVQLVIENDVIQTSEIQQHSIQNPRDAIFPTSKQEVCHFCYQTNSGRRSGKVAWHTNPPISFWPGKVPGLVRLCSSCYQCGYRVRARGNIPQMPQAVVPTEARLCILPSATVVQCARVKPLVLSNQTSFVQEAVPVPVPASPAVASMTLVLVNKRAPTVKGKCPTLRLLWPPPH